MQFSSCLCLFNDWQTLKGGLSETRIEKRIVITGDSDIDHDQVRYTHTHTHTQLSSLYIYKARCTLFDFCLSLFLDIVAGFFGLIAQRHISKSFHWCVCRICRVSRYLALPSTWSSQGLLWRAYSQQIPSFAQMLLTLFNLSLVCVASVRMSDYDLRNKVNLFNSSIQEIE